MYKVMFVDDEEENLFLMEKIVDWEELGFYVCGIALDGTEGIQVFEETNPDIVFVDIQMDEMDGLTLISELQKRGHAALYVIVTAYDEFEYAKKAISLGVKNYLLKPISRKEMIPMLNEMHGELDREKAKADKDLFVNRQYETDIFSKAAARIKDRFLKREPREESRNEALHTEELNRVIAGRKLCSFVLFSPEAENMELMEAAADWGVEYAFPLYDGICLISEESRKNLICEAFDRLRHSVMRKKYLLQINESFSNAREFDEACEQGMRTRHYCFYEERECCWYSESVQMNFSPLSFHEVGAEEEEGIRQLICSASSEELLQCVKRKIHRAAEAHCDPESLADEMTDLLIAVKNQLTQTYHERAFLILRHQDLWHFHSIQTEEKLFGNMEHLVKDAAEGVRNVLENKGSYTVVGRAEDYIREHFSEPGFSAGETAEAVHLSRNYFLKLFKEEKKISFSDYVTAIKMEKAKRLLKETSETIYAVSREVGYESQYHFSRKFKRLYGITPNEYRNL